MANIWEQKCLHLSNIEASETIIHNKNILWWFYFTVKRCFFWKTDYFCMGERHRAIWDRAFFYECLSRSYNKTKTANNTSVYFEVTLRYQKTYNLPEDRPSRRTCVPAAPALFTFARYATILREPFAASAVWFDAISITSKCRYTRRVWPWNPE